MSSCISGGGRTYALDLEIVKSPASSTWSHSSSPSSTLSETSNSPIAISTRKPRTPRKRPNQTYNEAATLLSTVYPNIFSTKTLGKPYKFTKRHDTFWEESSVELLLPFRAIDNCGFLLHQHIPEKTSSLFEPKVVDSCELSCQRQEENDFQANSLEFCDGYQDDFDTESILDEEIEGGIDSIIGNLSMNNDSVEELPKAYNGYPMGLGLGIGGRLGSGFGMKGGVKALRSVDDGDWWRFPTVDVHEISPKFNPVSMQKKKKKIEKMVELTNTTSQTERIIPNSDSRPLLKLNHSEVLTAWSDRGSPFSEEMPELLESDGYARLAEIDLCSETGGVREASVLRYKEKRRTRLFSKKIRYQVRKVNADRRPRMKGRFVRRPNSASQR